MTNSEIARALLICLMLECEINIQAIKKEISLTQHDDIMEEIMHVRKRYSNIKQESPNEE